MFTSIPATNSNNICTAPAGSSSKHLAGLCLFFLAVLGLSQRRLSRVAASGDYSPRGVRASRFDGSAHAASAFAAHGLRSWDPRA